MELPTSDGAGGAARVRDANEAGAGEGVEQLGERLRQAEDGQRRAGCELSAACFRGAWGVIPSGVSTGIPHTLNHRAPAASFVPTTDAAEQGVLDHGGSPRRRQLGLHRRAALPAARACVLLGALACAVRLSSHPSPFQPATADDDEGAGPRAGGARHGRGPRGAHGRRYEPGAEPPEPVRWVFCWVEGKGSCVVVVVAQGRMLIRRRKRRPPIGCWGSWRWRWRTRTSR